MSKGKFKFVLEIKMELIQHFGFMYLGIQLFLKEWNKKSRLDYGSGCLGEDVRHHSYNAFPTLSCD